MAPRVSGLGRRSRPYLHPLVLLEALEKLRGNEAEGGFLLVLALHNPHPLQNPDMFERL